MSACWEIERLPDTTVVAEVPGERGGGRPRWPSPRTSRTDVLLEVRDLVKHFPGRRRPVRRPGRRGASAVDGVSFTIRRGETLGLVGESGCGKTTTGRCILQLERPTSGSVRFEGQELTTLAPAALRSVRRRIQVIFQDPYSSLNPRMTVGQIIGEPLAVHGIVPEPAARAARVQELLRQVRPPAPARPALSARAVGRPAPAGGHRAGARARAGADHLRRAGVRAGRLDPGADHQPARGPPARPRPDVPLHRPRPVGRPPHLRPRRRHVPRQDRGAGRPADALRGAAHPYTKALLSAVPIPDPVVEAEPGAGRPGRRGAEPAPPAPRVRRSTRAARSPSTSASGSGPSSGRTGPRAPAWPAPEPRRSGSILVTPEPPAGVDSARGEDSGAARTSRGDAAVKPVLTGWSLVQWSDLDRSRITARLISFPRQWPKRWP